MKITVHKSYIEDRRIMHFIKKLKKLELEARIRQEIFFAMNLKGFEKFKITGGK